MARIDNINNFLTDVADSIRTKTGKSDKISASSFDIEIASITTSEDLDTELATYNTELTEQEESLSGIVEYLENKIESGEPLLLQDKSVEITENGTTNVMADEGYDGLNSVEVTTNVASSGETPEKGFVITNWNENGYATEMEIYGDILANDYIFRDDGNHNNYKAMGTIEKITMSDTTLSIKEYCFYHNANLKELNLGGVQEIGTYGFGMCGALAKVTAPNIEKLGKNAFEQTNIIQISLPKIKELTASGYNSPLYNIGYELRAVWIGSSLEKMTNYIFNYSHYNMKKIFFDLPRATVEQLEGYSKGFSGGEIPTSNIICNDDEGFMTQEEFDAIDWATYTG